MCDRKTAFERDHFATASDQTKFTVAEGRNKVAVTGVTGPLSPKLANFLFIYLFIYLFINFAHSVIQ